MPQAAGDAADNCSCSTIGPFINTVGIQRDDVRRVQDLHRQPLLRRVVVALDADAAEPCVLECFLKDGREGFFDQLHTWKGHTTGERHKVASAKSFSAIYFYFYFVAPLRVQGADGLSIRRHRTEDRGLLSSINTSLLALGLN